MVGDVVFVDGDVDYKFIVDEGEDCICFVVIVGCFELIGLVGCWFVLFLC